MKKWNFVILYSFQMFNDEVSFLYYINNKIEYDVLYKILILTFKKKAKSKSTIFFYNRLKFKFR